MESPWKLLHYDDNTTTTAMEIPNSGCVVRTMSYVADDNDNYHVTESMTFVPWAEIEEIKDGDGKFVSRKLVGTKKF